ncbi:alpha/beta hydrolase [Thalassotalea sp. HSM 43]|nr:alpha/beta hydrolase [Thalassotalea sp. HSM 43]
MKESSLKSLICVIGLLFCWLGLTANSFASVSASASEPRFEVPRSTVVELHDETTSRTYPLFIKLPRSYHANTDNHYPVIYLTDALYSFQIASGATRYPMNIGRMEEAIIVAVSYSKGSKGATSRVRDYTPSKASDWKMQTGDAEQHALFIRDNVIPYIEKNYRTQSQRRTFVGNSLGGLLGAYLLFKHPDMFASYILGSPSVWFNNHDILVAKVIKPSSPIKVYVAVGSLERPEFGNKNDMVAGAEQLVKKITAQSGEQITLKFVVIDDAKHATAFPTTLIQGLDWIYGKP